MKQFKNTSFSILKTVVALFAVVLTITACNKNNENTPAPGVAGLALIHAAPGTPELSFQVNGIKNNIKALTFGKFINYGNILEGTYSLTVTKKDSTKVLATTSSTFKNGKIYSLFIADVPTKTGLTVIEDDLTSPVADKANVRFVNMSPNAGILDLSITGQATPLFTKTAFKAATAFLAVSPGTEVNFQINENTKTEVLAKIEKVKIEKGKIYTIWAKGLKAATDSTKLSIGMITNK
ncbi:hypothetical protein ABIB62_002906 [Mucilaginibacter sp. UYP25]|uniref:DUF4397 domain-containing protein n=1 Tax=unclassified Mucilaginibacter TaxID=2617802 RepID=UPI00339278B8